MRTLFFACLLGILSPFLLHSQSGSGWVEDKAAQEIMSKLSKKFTNVTSISAEIKMITENKTEKTKDEKKVSVLVEGNKYRLTFGNQLVYCNGAHLWIYNKDAQEVTLSYADTTETQQFNLPKIISDWSKNYRPKLIREEETNAGIQQIIDLTPKKRQDYHKIRLIINKNKQEITQAQFHYFDTTTQTYTFQTYKTNPKTTPEDFIFNTSAHPTVEIIDIR